jgi:chorismate synthase
LKCSTLRYFTVPIFGSVHNYTIATAGAATKFVTCACGGGGGGTTKGMPVYGQIIIDPGGFMVQSSSGWSGL